MTNDEWLDSLTIEEKMDVFYGMFYALDNIHHCFEWGNCEEGWKLFYDAFEEYFEPIYEAMAGDKRVSEWYQKERLGG